MAVDRPWNPHDSGQFSLSDTAGSNEGAVGAVRATGGEHRPGARRPSARWG